MKLRFHAASVDVDPDAERISFSEDGERTYFMLQRDDERPDEVLPDLGNVWVERDDQGHGGRGGVTQVTLERGIFRAEIDPQRAPFFAPYDAVEITFDAEEDDALESIATTLPRVLRGYLDRLRVDLPGLPAPAPVAARAPKAMAGPPRRRGPAVLSANVPRDARWSASSGRSVELVILLESRGGPLDHGVRIEIGGAALTGGLVEPIEACLARSSAQPFVRHGDVARVELPELRLDADLEPDPNVRRGASSAPSTRVTLRARAGTVGKALLTVRVTPRTSREREGSAMVGRTFIVDPS